MGSVVQLTDTDCLISDVLQIRSDHGVSTLANFDVFLPFLKKVSEELGPYSPTILENSHGLVLFSRFF